MSEVEIYALDLDEEFLSHLAISESWTAIRQEHVADELIEDAFVRDIYRWQKKHAREHKKPATASVLADEFDVDFDEPLTAVGDLIERMRERWLKNNVRSRMERVGEAYKEDPAKVIDVLPKVAREIQQIAGPVGQSLGTGDFEVSMQKYDEMVLRGPGASFGFKEVDHQFDTMRGLTFGAAPPKTYKSWIYGVNTLHENTLQGRPGVLFSLELSAHETDMRLRCRFADVPYWKFLRRSLTHEDRKRLEEASELADGCGLYQVVQPPMGQRTIDDMFEIAYDMGAEYMVVDQLQYVETDNGRPLGSGDPGAFWQPLNRARDLADEIPMLIVHQFNRSVMNADKMPEMQQLKGASSIEETATLVLGLWANKDMRRSNLVELGTLASRHFTFEAWEIGVELTKGCGFELLGKAVHDDELDD